MVRMQAKVNNVFHGKRFKQVQMKRTKMIMESFMKVTTVPSFKGKQKLGW